MTLFGNGQDTGGKSYLEVIENPRFCILAATESRIASGV